MFLFLLSLYLVLVLCFFPAAVADRSVAVYLVVDYHGINFFEPLFGGVVTPHFEIMVEDESRITLYFHHPVGGGSHPILKSWWKMNHESPSIFIILLEEGVLAPFWNPLTPFCHKRGGPFSIRNHIVQVAMTLDLCISFPVSISEGRGTPQPPFNQNFMFLLQFPAAVLWTKFVLVQKCTKLRPQQTIRKVGLVGRKISWSKASWTKIKKI